MSAKPTTGSVILSSSDHRPEGFRWLTLKRIKYRDPTGRERLWESAERTTRKGPVDAVAIIAQVKSKEKPLQIILESQFRPSQGSYVIELPAGLIDDGESAETAALRELKEETGYQGEAVVTVHVDADSPANKDVKPELEDSEFIEVFLLPFQGLYVELQKIQEEKGWDIDARLLIYALGVQQASSF